MGREDNIETKDFTDFFDNPQARILVKDQLNGRPLNCACFALITLKSPESFLVSRKNRVVMINIGDAGPTTPRKNGIFAALDSAHHLAAALLKNGNTAAGLAEYRTYIKRRYVWDNRWSDVVLKTSDLVLNNRLPRQATVYLAKNRLPFLSSVARNTVSHVLTGRDSYWKIPTNVLWETLKKPLG